MPITSDIYFNWWVEHRRAVNKRQVADLDKKIQQAEFKLKLLKDLKRVKEEFEGANK